MLEITANLNTLGTQTIEIPAPIDPALSKFISIIQASKKLKNFCVERKLLTWLNSIETEHCSLQSSTFLLDNTYSQKKIEKRQRIALIYANVLELYVPKENGSINLHINYTQLVSAVKKVFKNHIRKNGDLFSTGIQILVNGKPFFAKVEGSRVCIFSRIGKLMGKGSYGRVIEIYEISSRRFLALKEAYRTPCGLKAISTEICNLKMIRTLAENSSVEGLQAAPFATFNIPSLVGFIGPIYGVNLQHWLQGPHENAKRIAMCKSLMRAFKHKTELGVWHGDIKIQNILTHEEGCVIIDWAGSILFQDAFKKGLLPTVFSPAYTNRSDKKRLGELYRRIELRGKEDKSLNETFFEISNAIDLFSTAIVLFRILAAVRPFGKISRNELLWPDTKQGINKISMLKLLEMNYSSDAVQTITKMLAHDYKMRFSFREAIEVWDRIELEQ